MQFLAFPIDSGKLEAPHWSFMARYRIKQRPSYCIPNGVVFETEERCLFWWEYRGFHLSLEEAEQHIAELRSMTPVQTKIVKEYN